MALRFRIIAPRGHSITKHTGGGGGLARRSESKTPKYLSKNSNISKSLKSYPKIFLRYSPRAQRLSVWDKFSFSLRIIPLIIHKNHFIYPLTIVHINIFENIFSQPKSQTPNNRASPPYRVPPPGIYAQHMVKTKFDEILVAREKIVDLSVANMQCVIPFVLFLNCLYSTNRRHLLLSIPSVLAMVSDRRANNNSILKAGRPKIFSTQDRPF